MALGKNVWDKNKLFVHKLLKPQMGELLPVSGPLNTAERKIRPAHVRIVDKDHSCLDAAGDALGPLNIGGVDRPSESKRRIVCNRDGLSFVFGWKDKSDRPKEFLLVGRIVRRDASKDGGLQECSDCSGTISAK